MQEWNKCRRVFGIGFGAQGLGFKGCGLYDPIIQVAASSLRASRKLKSSPGRWIPKL